jgi:sulfoxide reductase heme-binding subunit YedZ
MVRAYGKILVFLLCLYPFAWLSYRAVTGQLAPDTGKVIILECGEYALQLLLITLALRPLSKLTNFTGLLRYRRMFGLYSYFYATVHLLSVLTYMLGWSWVLFIEEFADRPYMALGIIAWLLMLPLAVTSNRWSQRKLRKRWKTLHRVNYIIVVLACAHLVWQLRSDFGEALAYSLILVLLLAFRLQDQPKARAV